MNMNKWPERQKCKQLTLKYEACCYQETMVELRGRSIDWKKSARKQEIPYFIFEILIIWQVVDNAKLNSIK